MKFSTILRATGTGLALAGLSLSATANEPSIRIDTRLLDMSKPEVLEAVYARVERAALNLCRDAISSWDSRRAANIRRCVQGSIDEAVSRANLATLTALHQEKTRERPIAEMARR